tara:strand:+ start:809 stop:1714 length:906 start_codon:yes stop_codon:yes gene_type:complete
MTKKQRNFGPDYLGIGPWNTGTTWFDHQFQNHPSFARLPFKELHYLDGINQALPFKPKNAYWKRRALIHKKRRSPFQKELWHSMSTVNLAWLYFYYFAAPSVKRYRNLFPKKREVVTGEFSPEAIFYEQDLIQKIYQSYPNLKLIVGLRNPLERDLSALNRKLTFQKYSPQNPQNVQNKKRFHQQLEKEHMYFYNYLPNWLEVFPTEQFFFYDFREIRRNPQQLLKKTCDFLNVPYVKNYEVENQILNPSSSVHNIPQAIKKNIAAHHYKHIKKFIEADYVPNAKPIFREWLETLKKHNSE